MKHLEPISRSDKHENVIVLDDSIHGQQQAHVEINKHILSRVRDRLESELHGDGPHVNHNSHQDHQDTYTP